MRASEQIQAEIERRARAAAREVRWTVDEVVASVIGGASEVYRMRMIRAEQLREEIRARGSK